MRRGREIAIAAVAVSLLGVAGCGGGSGGASSQASAEKASLTRQEWVDKANEICHDASEKKVAKMTAYQNAHDYNVGEPSVHEREAVNTSVVLPNVQERIEALEALPVPPGEEAKIRAILRSMESGIREAEAHPENLAIPKQPIPFKESEHLAGAYGLLFCGMP
ncbi:MAG TPA: hypothetical protein VFJ65_08215 [Solirubrobacterales bacterium]|nr:hypothetical protein [Solirubrobacterales bacterium]